MYLISSQIFFIKTYFLILVKNLSKKIKITKIKIYAYAYFDILEVREVLVDFRHDNTRKYLCKHHACLVNSFPNVLAFSRPECINYDNDLDAEMMMLLHF